MMMNQHDPRRRKVQSGRAVDALRSEINGWTGSRLEDERYARFGSHLRTLQVVLNAMLTAVDDEIAAVDELTVSTGAVYSKCRLVERRINLVRRTHRWYAEKYDQRRDSRLAPVLLAADELVRSCWTEPFASAHVTPPTGPLVYLEARFDAAATPRVSVPPDLRAPGDAVVGEFVRSLPVPIIALPATCVIEPWWMVLAAHETGHHIQHDLGQGLADVTRRALFAATSGTPGNPDLAADWQRWAVESFADAFSVLMVGSAASWAVQELLHGPATEMVTAPTGGDRYPPTIVRIALLDEITSCAGLPQPNGGIRVVREWLSTVPRGEVSDSALAAVERHLAVTPAAAAALVDLPVRGVPLHQLCAVIPEQYHPHGDVDHWAERLVQQHPVFTQRSSRYAARTAIAAGVTAYQSSDQDDHRIGMRLRENLLSLLATCGPSGVLSAGPAVVGKDIEELADRLAARLLAITFEGE